MKRAAGLVLALAVLALPGSAAAGSDVGLDATAVDAASVDGPGLAEVTFATKTRHHASTNASDREPDAPLFLAPAFRDQRAGAPGSVSVPDSARNAAGVAVGAALGIGLVVLFWNTVKTWLLGGVLVPLFSRINGNRILDNDVRSKVHEAILHNPGITIKEITQVLDIGWGTAIYHLKRLESERLVVSERHRQFRRFFKNGGGIVNDAKVAFAELKNPTTHRLATALLDRPGSAQKDLCEALGISAPLAHKYLARMEDANLLTKQREWKTVKYFPTGKLSELVRGAPAIPPAVLVAIG
ncbi:MAG: winged helix-turn-helix transcriptional regulator [Euryarchaeota archaeon]|nr:winged helix-turn-helix transcriptional regulator [Euryarchaeota archaeon]